MKLERIQDKLNEGQKYLNHISNITDNEFEVFIKDDIDKLAAERLFEIIAQILIDSCTRIVAFSKLDTPNTYSQCFEQLAQHQIIEIKLADRLVKLVKMRNLITHRYTEINYKLLFEGLQQIPIDFDQFRKNIFEWIKQNK